MTSISINLVNIFTKNYDVHNDKQQIKKKHLSDVIQAKALKILKKTAWVFYFQWIRDYFAYTIFIHSICIYSSILVFKLAGLFKM